jgi:hypothetical protein
MDGLFHFPTALRRGADVRELLHDGQPVDDTALLALIRAAHADMQRRTA